jgi:D-3-phosphoglycerate dehydrogenase
MKYACLNPISEFGLQALPAGFEKTEDLNEADAILVRSAVMHEMEFAPALKCVARAGAGVNNIPLDVLRDKGVVVFNTPGANANAVKELTVLALLLTARDVPGGMAWVRENKEDENLAKSMEKAKKKFAGHEVYGKTLGVIGLGAIGFMVAETAVALGMKVVGYDPFLPDALRAKLPAAVTVVEDQKDVFRAADYITVHVPENDATRGTFRKEAFAEMKDGVVLLNLARAGLVNEDDLEEALKSGKVARYITDVPDKRVANMPNVIGFPHLGASTEEAEDNCAKMAAEELGDFLLNGNIRNSVNFPAVTLGAKEGARTLVLFKEGAETEKMKVLVPGFTKLDCKVKKGAGAALFEGGKASEGLKALDGVVRVLEF